MTEKPRTWETAVWEHLGIDAPHIIRLAGQSPPYDLSGIPGYVVDQSSKWLHRGPGGVLERAWPDAGRR